MRNELFVGAVVVMTAIGCGGDGLTRVPIQGELVAGGEPVPNASISFMPQEGTKGEGAIGKSDAQGKFEVISSRNDDKGIPPGKYKVVVSRFMDKDGTILAPDAKQADFPNAVESIPAPFSTAASTLEVNIPESGGPVKIEIPAKIKGKK